jgi:AcrR family transcriptional regulator
MVLLDRHPTYPTTGRARAYVSPLRTAGAASTRRRILAAAREVFEQRGWSGTSLRQVGTRAGVSPKTIQAQFQTKARLLAETVDFAVRGEPDQSTRRGAAAAIRRAPDAPEALALHAALITEMAVRTAGLAAVVETGAAADPALVPLWNRMRDSMQFGVRWAADTVLGKAGLRDGLTRADVETVFQVAMAWSTYRTLVSARGMTPEQIERWIGQLYERMLLA